MTYRDDLVAAQARAAAAERRAAVLEHRLARAADATVTPQPARMALTRDGDALQITWRWRGWRHLYTAAFAAVWDAVLIGWYASGVDAGAFLFSLAHLAVGVVITYEAAAGLLNRTTVRARPGQLQIRHAPLPWRGTRTIERATLAQLYVRRIERGGPNSTVSWQLSALLTTGRELPLVRGLPDVAEARYLEREVERALAIPDRPVDGEAG